MMLWYLSRTGNKQNKNFAFFAFGTLYFISEIVLEMQQRFKLDSFQLLYNYEQYLDSLSIYTDIFVHPPPPLWSRRLQCSNNICTGFIDCHWVYYFLTLIAAISFRIQYSTLDSLVCVLHQSVTVDTWGTFHLHDQIGLTNILKAKTMISSQKTIKKL